MSEHGVLILLVVALVTAAPTTEAFQPSKGDRRDSIDIDSDGGARAGVAIYHGCLVAFYDNGWTCSVSGLRAEPDQWGLSALYGYVMRASVPSSHPIFRGCVRAFTVEMRESSCAAVGLRSSADPSHASTLIGYARSSAGSGMRPLFQGCLTPTIDDFRNVTSCRDYGLRATADPWGFSSVIGYASTAR